MHPSIPHLLALAIGLAPAACAQRAAVARTPSLPVPVPATPVADARADDAAVLAAIGYRHGLLELSPAELRREYDYVRAKHVARREAVEPRLQLIALMSLAHAETRNLNAALELIDDYLDTAATDDRLAQYLWLLADHLEALREAEQRAQQAGKRLEQLQQQLNALKSLEHNLRERDPPPRDVP